MRTLTQPVQFVFLIGILLISVALSPAQDADLLRHFDYDQQAPLNLKHLGEAPRALNAEARRDRIQFLIEQLRLKPISDAQIAGIPNLYQSAEPK